MATPILLDTDIGTDIDDVYALILAATSPELDLRAVTVVNNDVLTRGKIARRILDLLGRSDVPVALGQGRSLTTGESRGWMGHEGRGIDLDGIDPDRDFAPYDAANMIAGAAREAYDDGNPLTIVTIGAMKNLALALKSDPALQDASRIVAMASTFEGFGPENAQPEHNVACDPAAVSVVLDSGFAVSLIGLNVTRKTRMDSAQVEEIAAVGGPLADSIAGMHRVWFEAIGRNYSPMHDGLAVAAVFRQDLLEFRPVKTIVHRERSAVEFNAPKTGEVTTCEVAVAVDAESYRALLFGRVLDAVRASRRLYA